MKNAKFYLLVGLLTAGNLGFRVISEADAKHPTLVSTLEAGAVVVSPEVDDVLIAASALEARCGLVIAFNPDCPFCNEAAALERQTGRAGPYQSVWVTDSEYARLPGFVDRLAPTSRWEVSHEAYDALGVVAVPAAYLLTPEGVVRRAWRYKGSESTEQLDAWCTGEESAPIMASSNE